MKDGHTLYSAIFILKKEAGNQNNLNPFGYI
jgi:hypothetical protein